MAQFHDSHDTPLRETDNGQPHHAQWAGGGQRRGQKAISRKLNLREKELCNNDSFSEDHPTMGPSRDEMTGGRTGH